MENTTDEYMVVSGHRRLHVAQKAGLETVPAFIYALDRDAATIAAVDSNLHREHILPSEKAFAYRMKFDAIKHQGQRSDLTSGQVVQKWSRDNVSETESGRGSCKIHYIRNVVLEKIVLEAISDFVDFVRCYEPVFLYMLAKKSDSVRQAEYQRLQQFVRNGEKRIDEIDRLIESLYEDRVLRNVEDARYQRMMQKYEKEQRDLAAEVENAKAELQSAEKDIQAMMDEVQKNPQKYRYVA